MGHIGGRLPDLAAEEGTPAGVSVPVALWDSTASLGVEVTRVGHLTPVTVDPGDRPA